MIARNNATIVITSVRLLNLAAGSPPNAPESDGGAPFAEGGGGRPGDVDSSVVAGLHVATFASYARLNGQVPLVGIVAGRRPLKDLEEWRDRWRKAGGDAIRQEYVESLERAESK